MYFARCGHKTVAFIKAVHPQRFAGAGIGIGPEPDRLDIERRHRPQRALPKAVALVQVRHNVLLAVTAAAAAAAAAALAPLAGGEDLLQEAPAVAARRRRRGGGGGRRPAPAGEGGDGGEGGGIGDRLEGPGHTGVGGEEIERDGARPLPFAGLDGGAEQ